MSEGRRRVLRAARAAIRVARGQSAGHIVATPNPISLGRTGLRTTTLRWQAVNTGAVEVRLGSPDGRLVSRSDRSGTVTTGNWVNNGMVFYLQDVSDGRPLDAAHTLDRIRVTLTA